MKGIYSFFIFVLVLVTGCGQSGREKELQERQEALDRREKELLQRETALQSREEALLQKEQLDSSLRDTMQYIDSSLMGIWQVEMTCTETNCTGSAVGDTKSEQWHLSFAKGEILARAMSDKQLIRVYRGIYTGNTVELVAEPETLATQPAKIVVRLRIVNDTSLEGQREIVRDNCKIIYDLKMKKQ